MLAIKFSRKGKKNQPFFRIIVLEKHKDIHGDFLEDLGFYNPLTKKTFLNVKRVKHWLSCGAQPTGSVHNLLVKKGIIKAEKIKVTSMSKKKIEKKKQDAEKPKTPKQTSEKPKESKEPEAKKEKKQEKSSKSEKLEKE